MAKMLLFLLVMVLPSFGIAQEWYTPLKFTFDAGDTAYLHAVTIDSGNHHHNSWQIGRPGKATFDSARSWPNAIVTDTLAPYLPNDTSVFVLGLRNLVYTTSWWHAISSVSFYYKMDCDTGSKGIIEYSVDTGRTWHRTAAGISELPDTVTFTHSTSGWKLYNVGLLDYMSDSMLLRFTFISDTDTSSNDGWMIDDISVQYWSEDVPTLTRPGTYVIYPNPVAGDLVITSASIIGSVWVYNTCGQIVHQGSYRGSRAQIDVSQFPTGLYEVYINGVASDKFFKN